MLGSKEVSGVQRPIANEFEGVKVDSIGAGFGDDVDDCATQPVLGGEVFVLNVELLNRVRVGKRQVRIQVRIVMTGAVHLVIDGPGPRPVDVAVLLTRVHAALAVHEAIVARFVERARREEKEFLRLPAVQRQIQNLLLINELADRARSGGQHGGVGRNGHLLR